MKNVWLERQKPKIQSVHWPTQPPYWVEITFYNQLVFKGSVKTNGMLLIEEVVTPPHISAKEFNRSITVAVKWAAAHLFRLGLLSKKIYDEAMTMEDEDI
jgi:hypothetical protein